MEENSQQNIIPTPSEVINKRTFNKSWVLVTGLVILTAVLLVISLSRRNFSGVPSATKQEQANFAHTSLSISESPRVASAAGVYETDVNIDSKDNQITGVDLELTFDPKVLTKVDIKPGSFIPNAVVLNREVDPIKGTISLTIGTSQRSRGVKGTGAIAVISFSKTGSAETTIQFLPNTLVTAEGQDQSVLSETASAVIGVLPSTTGN